MLFTLYMKKSKALLCSVFSSVTAEPSRVCVVKVEQMNPPHAAINGTLEQVIVKQERLEDEEEVEMDGSSCCLDFTLERMSVVQSKMLEDWKPDVLDIQSQDSNTQGKRQSQSGTFHMEL